jgi:hypothetical protein
MELAIKAVEDVISFMTEEDKTNYVFDRMVDEYLLLYSEEELAGLARAGIRPALQLTPPPAGEGNVT